MMSVNAVSECQRGEAEAEAEAGVVRSPGTVAC